MNPKENLLSKISNYFHSSEKPYTLEVKSSHILGYNTPALNSLAGDNFKPFTKCFASVEARADFLKKYEDPIGPNTFYNVVNTESGNTLTVGLSMTPKQNDFGYQIGSYNNRSY